MSDLMNSMNETSYCLSLLRISSQSGSGSLEALINTSIKPTGGIGGPRHCMCPAAPAALPEPRRPTLELVHGLVSPLQTKQLPKSAELRIYGNSRWSATRATVNASALIGTAHYYPPPTTRHSTTVFLSLLRHYRRQHGLEARHPQGPAARYSTQRPTLSMSPR